MVFSSTIVKISPTIFFGFLAISLVSSSVITTDDICCFTYNTMANAMILQNSSDDSAYYMSVDNCVVNKMKSNRNCSSFINYNLHKNNVMEFKKELEVIRTYQCDTMGVCEKVYPYNETNPNIFTIYRIFYTNMEEINWYIKIIDKIIWFFYH